MVTTMPTQTSQPRQQLAAVSAETALALDALSEECCAIAGEEVAGRFSKALAVAHAIQRLRMALTAPVMKDVMALQGSKLGFRTDRDREKEPGYPENVVKECLIESILWGAYPVNNEWNIIAGNTYLALNFFRRVLDAFPGLANPKLFPGVPVLMNGGALVQYAMEFELNGKPTRIERGKYKAADGTEVDERIPVRVNAGMGVDAILGKAERKMRAFVYQRLRGSSLAIPDGEVEHGETLPAVTSELPTGRTSMRRPPKNGTTETPGGAGPTRQPDGPTGASVLAADTGAPPTQTSAPGEPEDRVPPIPDLEGRLTTSASPAASFLAEGEVASDDDGRGDAWEPRIADTLPDLAEVQKIELELGRKLAGAKGPMGVAAVRRESLTRLLPLDQAAHERLMTASLVKGGGK
jgi:hypothetical protein